MEWPDNDDELLKRYLEEENGGQYLDPAEEEYGDYYDDYEDYYDDEDEYTRISVSELADRCILPTIHQAIITIYPLLALCIFVRLFVHFSSKYLSKFPTICSQF